VAQDITLRVNGRSHNLHIEPEAPLLYILRNDLGLKGAKFGCGLEQCGACKVIIEGRAVPSCRISVESVQGLEVTTLEGLGTIGNLHPLQKAFIEEGAIQCGFCVGGMIVAAKALLDRNPHPTDSEIRQELATNLCRCGAHGRILKAVKRATVEMKG
jgi:nicotinate dehydrogenase subunit A